MMTMERMAPAFGLTVNQTLFEKLRVFEDACVGIWDKIKCTPQRRANCKFRFGEFFEATCKECKRK